MSYGVVILSYKRRSTLEQCVDHVMAQSPSPRAVLVWHNAPSVGQVKGVMNIYAEHNYGCSARHAAAKLLNCKHTILVDDDVLLVNPSACETLISELSALALVVGVAGRNLERGDHPYSHGTEDVKEGNIDVVKGWFQAVDTRALGALAGLNLPQPIKDEDDITLCAAASMRYTWAVPKIVRFPAGSFRFLRDQVGQMNRPDHKERRDAACKHMMALGWVPQSWA